jgi:diketogulonate reductase-like aldo/keto reductase
MGCFNSTAKVDGLRATQPQMIPASLTLNNGYKIPIKGLGTFLSLEFDTDYLRTAIKLGYRHIDTAFYYQNEHLIGNALEVIIKEGLVSREDIFITTKVLNGQEVSVDDQIEKS